MSRRALNKRTRTFPEEPEVIRMAPEPWFELLLIVHQSVKGGRQIVHFPIKPVLK